MKNRQELPIKYSNLATDRHDLAHHHLQGSAGHGKKGLRGGQNHFGQLCKIGDAKVCNMPKLRQMRSQGITYRRRASRQCCKTRGCG